MPGIFLEDNDSFEIALRRFKKQVEKAGVLSELKKRLRDHARGLGKRDGLTINGGGTRPILGPRRLRQRIRLADCRRSCIVRGGETGAKLLIAGERTRHVAAPLQRVGQRLEHSRGQICGHCGIGGKRGQQRRGLFEPIILYRQQRPL